MLTAGVLAASVIALLSSALLAQEFTIRQDGGVEVGGMRFPSMEQYVQSDYFRQNGKRCGVRRMASPDADTMRLEKSVADCTTGLTNIRNEYWPAVVYTIPVWFHVIYRSDGVGNIPDSAILAQMAVLNEDFRAQAGTLGGNGFDVKIQFELAGITRTMNNNWYTDSEADESAYKAALARDPNRFLNIYTNDASGFLGYAYLPQGSAGRPWDGIVLLHTAVGGRNNGFGLYDQGRTLVHEMGHYLGLLHTFEEGTSCPNSYSAGDLIVDTNSEFVEHYDCIQTASCGTLDPIENYMNYTPDTCMFRFTAEQGNRSVCSLVNYRPSLFTISGGEDPEGETPTILVPPVLMPLILN